MHSYHPDYFNQFRIVVSVHVLRFSITDKDDKIKTVEELLETGLIEMANKEEELKVMTL